MTTLTDHQRWYREVYLFSDHWKSLRLQAFKEGGRHCHRCPATTHLDVHHLRYRRLYDVTVQDLQILCRKCHEREHTPPPAIAFHNLPAEIAQQIQWFVSKAKPGSAKGKRNGAINRTVTKLKQEGALSPEMELQLKMSKSGSEARKLRRLQATGMPADKILSLTGKKLKRLLKIIP